jgi:double zinc ribbon protein
VICAGCARDNPAAARFCGGCGAPLEARCPACQSPNPPDNRFCHHCGVAVDGAPTAAPTGPSFASPRSYTPRHLAEKILTSAGALEGERKQVTVLFVDVSGFTSLSERLDPEDVHGLMRRAFELMLAEVHANEGTVNQFRGITFRARQGLNTGLVVVGSIGGDLRMDYTAIGDTTTWRRVCSRRASRRR